MAFGAAECFGEKSDELRVGFAIDGRGVQLHQQHGTAFFIGGPTGELGFLRVRSHPNGKLGAVIHVRSLSLEFRLQAVRYDKVDGGRKSERAASM